MRLNRLPVVVVMLLLIVVAHSRAYAQGTASVDGTVADPSNALIDKAQVSITNMQTGLARAGVSSAEGYFVFTDLVPGIYKVQIAASGFKTWVQENLVLAVGQRLTLHPQMQVGSEIQEIAVTDVQPLVTTASSTVSTVVESKRIEDLPLNGRNALQLLALAPGNVAAGSSGQFGARQLVFSSSGSRSLDTSFSLDGGNNQDAFYSIANSYPNPDALQEFAVSNRNYSAKFGHGTTDVSAVTRSGTNQFHGSLFEFLRNTSLDARPYFAAARPNFQRNQFGGALGGPIVHNKLFFFLSYQGTEQVGSPGDHSYPTIPLAQRTGDFSALADPIIDPETGMPFPGNVVPADRITAQSQAFFEQWLPAPNVGSDTYSFQDKGRMHQHQGIMKVDYQVTPKDMFTARYFIDDVPQFGFASGSGAAISSDNVSELPTRYQSTTLGYVRTFSPNLLNDFHISYVRSAFGVFPKKSLSLAELGYGVSEANANLGFGLTPDAELDMDGYFSAYVGAPTRDIMPTMHIADNLSWVKGRHNFNFGVEIYRNRVNETQNFVSGGDLEYSGQFTGNTAADFLIGRYASYLQISGVRAGLRQTLSSAYVQDDIKLTRRLTLNAGLRWDVAPGYSSENRQLAAFVPGRQSTVFPLSTEGLLYPGDDGIPSSIFSTRWNNFAPRVGLAWDVRGNGTTSVRAGFGTFYIPLTRGISYNRQLLIQPFNLTVLLFAGDDQDIFAQAPYNGVNPFPRPTATDYEGLKTLPFQPTASAAAIDTNFKTETHYEWSLSVQQALWKHAVLETNYVGSSSSHLVTSVQANPAVYIPGNSTPGNTQDRRLYPEIGDLNLITPALNGNYHSLQVTFDQQLARNVLVKSTYTWSKSLQVAGCEGEGCNGPRDPFNYHRDYGPSAFDVRHNWVSSFIWQPFGESAGSPLRRYAVTGWQFGGILSLRTGFPLTLVSGRDNSLTGVGGDTPDVVGNWHLSGNRSKSEKIAEWFNTDAFVPNAIGTFGQLSHGALTNPGLVNFDLNIQKNFQVNERYRVEFRSSLYNCFNHANLGAPNGNLASSAFGRIFSATDPRVIEFGLKLKF
ncbi:MAG: TonB-dependent receptor [Acidobacteria bacterium]|nr:TonB-dependent receptor [Acidobacteriota bacterium]